MARSHLQALGRIAAPVGVSAAVSENLKKQAGIAVRTVRNGVDTDVWTPAAESERANLRCKLGLAQEGAVWVSVGHLSERKDPMTVIRAFQRADIKNSQLVFLGSGPQEAACRAAAEGWAGATASRVCRAASTCSSANNSGARAWRMCHST